MRFFLHPSSCHVTWHTLLYIGPLVLLPSTWAIQPVLCAIGVRRDKGDSSNGRESTLSFDIACVQPPEGPFSHKSPIHSSVVLQKYLAISRPSVPAIGYIVLTTHQNPKYCIPQQDLSLSFDKVFVCQLSHVTRIEKSDSCSEKPGPNNVEGRGSSPRCSYEAPNGFPISTGDRETIRR